MYLWNNFMIFPSHHLASSVLLLIFYECSILEMPVLYCRIKRYC